MSNPFASFKQTQTSQLQARVNQRVSGATQRPYPPKDVQAQPGNGKVVLSWVTDLANKGEFRTQIAVDTESNIFAELPSSVLTTTIPASTDGDRAIYLRSVNPNGQTSRWIFVKAGALGDSPGPSDPPTPVPPPSDIREAGSGGCFSGETLIETEHGPVRFDALRAGDIVATASGKLLPIKEIHEHRGKWFMADMGCGLVTLDHPILVGHDWRSAIAIFHKRVAFTGTVYNLTVESGEPLELSRSSTTERSFVLSVSGIRCHNFKPLR